MKINSADVVAEVTEFFHRYETAFVTNDIETLDALFWSSDLTVRLGASENLFGQRKFWVFATHGPASVWTAAC